MAKCMSDMERLLVHVDCLRVIAFVEQAKQITRCQKPPDYARDLVRASVFRYVAGLTIHIDHYVREESQVKSLGPVIRTG
jgi:hypothetical protein